jgi:sugar phosphate isomerase/epimerase
MVLDRLAQLRYGGLELLGAPGRHHPDEIQAGAPRATLRHELERRGLGVPLYCPRLGQYPPASPGEETHRGYLVLFEKNLAFCRDLGIPLIRVDSCVEPRDLSATAEKEAIRAITTTWRACATAAAAAGITVAWEFEPGFLFNKPSHIFQILDMVDHPRFTVLFDTCHAQMSAVIGARQPGTRETFPGGLPALARRLGSRIGYVHLSDSDNTLHHDKTSTHAPLGKGVIDFDPVLAALLEAGYRGPWWSVDPCFWPRPWEVVEDDKRFVDQLLHRHGLI